MVETELQSLSDLTFEFIIQLVHLHLWVEKLTMKSTDIVAPMSNVQTYHPLGAYALRTEESQTLHNFFT
jgi:hypothetical protein